MILFDCSDLNVNFVSLKNSFVFRICFQKATKANSVSLIIRCYYLFCKFIVTTLFVIGLNKESTSTIQYTLGLYTLLKL